MSSIAKRKEANMKKSWIKGVACFLVVALTGWDRQKSSVLGRGRKEVRNEA
jgi:hypothetical protein